MSEEPKPRSPGCLSRLFSLFLFLAAVGLFVALFYATQPQDLSDIKGYGADATPPRDLTLALRNAEERGYPLTISEADLNSWLGHTLSAKQSGMLESQVKLKGVAIRLEKKSHCQSVSACILRSSSQVPGPRFGQGSKPPRLRMLTTV